jgi:hypothetical protein
MRVHYKFSSTPSTLDQKHALLTHQLDDLPYTPSPDEEEDDEDVERSSREPHYDLNAVPHISSDLVTGFEAGDEAAVLVTLRDLRFYARHYGSRLFAPLVESSICPFLTTIITGCPIPKVRLQALRTLLFFQESIREVREVVARLPLIDPLFALIEAGQGEFPSRSLVNVALRVLYFVAEHSEDRLEIQQRLPLEMIYKVHLFFWNPPVDEAAPFEGLLRNEHMMDMKLRWSLGYWSHLPHYCLTPLDGSDYEFVMNLLNQLFHTRPPDEGTRHAPEHSTPYEELMGRSLYCLLNLIESGSLPPGDFDGDFGAIVNGEILGGHYKTKAVACDIWTALIEKGAVGDGVEIDPLLDVIDNENNIAGRRAMHLFATMLRLSPDSEGLVQALVSANETSQGFRTFLVARKKNFDSMHACAICLKEIFARSGERELAVLVCPEVFKACTDFLQLDDPDSVAFAVHAMSEMIDYVQRFENDGPFRELLQIFLEADAAETLFELTSQPTSPEFQSYAERLMSLVEESGEM